MSSGGAWEDQLLDTLKGLACGLHEWSIPIAIAAAVRLYTGKGSNLRQTSTDALTGFRIISATFIVMEHAHKSLLLNGAGVFLVLSGCVISLSRRKEPGLLKSTFTSVREALKFVFIRLLRVVPLYWVYYAVCQVMAEQTTHEGGPKQNGNLMIGVHHDCFGLASPVQFLAQVLLNLAKLFLAHPWDLFNLSDSPVPKMNVWFVRTIAIMYMLYPVLELAIFGRAGQLTRRRAAVVVAVCVAVKLGTFCFALWAIHVGRGVSYITFTGIDLDGIWPCPEIPQYLEIPAELTGPIPFRVMGSEKPCSIDWYRNAYTRMPEFVLGMLIPHVDVQSEAAVVCSDVAALVVFLVTFLKPAAKTQMEMIPVRQHMFIPFSLLIIWGLCFGPKQSRFGKILCTPCFVAAGNFAYGVYIWQTPLKDRYVPEGSDLQWNSPSFPFYLAFLYVVAWTTHRLVEEPVSDLARYLMGKASRAPPAEPPGSPEEGSARLLEAEEEKSSDDTDSGSSSESSGDDRVCCTARR